MEDATKKERMKLRRIISITAGILIGITFIVSGTGKIIGIEETPAQVVDFISNIIPEVFLTPGIVYFIYQILIPHLVPWIELLIGLFLVTGIAPRLMAIFCLPLIAAFMGTNIWSIVKGGYATCASCFGIWENIFGSLTPVQSLIYDIVLLILALAVIVLVKGSVLSCSQYLVNACNKLMPGLRTNLSRWFPDFIKYYLDVKGALIKYRGFVIGILIALVAAVILASVIQPSNSKPVAKNDIAITNTSISKILPDRVVISWQTREPTVSRVLLFDSAGKYFRELVDVRMVSEHQVTLGDLSEQTEYYYEVRAELKSIPGEDIARRNYFKTTALDTTPLKISSIEIKPVSDSSAAITWNTSKPASGVLEYWLSNSPELKKEITSNEIEKQHVVNLPDLLPAELYGIRISEADAGGEKAEIKYENYFSLSTGIKRGMFAPDFSLVDLDGNTVKLSDYRGRVVLLDFWIWTCSACRTKLPMIQEIYNSVPREKLEVLSIHYQGRDSVIKNFVSSLKLSLPVLMDINGEIADLYEVISFPTVFHIDANGIIRNQDAYFESASELRALINEVISN